MHLYIVIANTKNFEKEKISENLSITIKYLYM